MPEKTTQKEHGKKTAPPSEKEVQPEVVIQIPLAELHPFPDHPFQVRDDDTMRETAESVKAYGVLVPAIVRPREEGGYEIIGGCRLSHERITPNSECHVQRTIYSSLSLMHPYKTIPAPIAISMYDRKPIIPPLANVVLGIADMIF